MADETKAAAASEAAKAAPETENKSGAPASTDAGSKKETAKAEQKADVKADAKKAPAAEEGKKETTEGKESTKEGDQKPAKELKSLLDDAGKEEEKSEGKAESKAPETYAEFKVPEGMVLDTALLEKAIPLFKNLNLSQDDAQKLVDLQSQIVKESEEKHLEDFNKYVDELKQESQKFFGPKLKETMISVAKARDQFIHKELQEKLNISGLANDKDMLIFLDKLGRTISEGRFVEGKPSGFPEGKEGRLPAAKMYDKMGKK